MSALLMIIGGIGFIASAVGGIIILIDAFQNEIWKGLLSIVCGLYSLYYMFAEFEHEKKGLVLLAVWGGAILGYAMMFMAAAMASS